MRRRALIGKMENRIFAPGERAQVNRRARHLQAAIMASELPERSFFLFFIWLEKTFEYELSVGRHLQRHSFAVYNLEGFAANRSRHCQLVDAERKRTGSRHHQAWINADCDRNWKRFGGRFAVLQHEVSVRSRENAEGAWAMYLIAINTDVAKPGHRVARVMTAERQKRAAVEIVEARCGKVEDVDVIAFENNLVARAAVDGYRRQRPADPPIPLVVNVQLIALHRQGVTLARSQSVYENRHVLAARALKQQRRSTASQACDADRAQLLIQVDRHTHA